MPTAKEIAAQLPGFMKNEGFEPIDVTIKDFVNVEVGHKEPELKPALTFEETKKDLILNMTRSNQLTDLFGEDEVIGQRIHLETGIEKIKGKVYEMICISKVKTKKKATAPPA